MKLIGSIWTHEEQIDCFIGFIEYLIVNSKKGNLSFEQLSTLFSIFVTTAVTEYESQQFFLFLTKENVQSTNRERRFLLNEQRRIQVFQEIMCSKQLMNVSRLGKDGIACFNNMFLLVNAANKLISMDPHDGFHVHQINKLMGFDTLSSIVIQSKDPIVQEESRNFFVDLFLKCKVEPKFRKSLTEFFLQILDSWSKQLFELGRKESQKEEYIMQQLNWLKLI